MIKHIITLLLLASSFTVFSQSISKKMIQAIQEEVNRNFKELQKEKDKPYYISIRIEETTLMNASSSFGTLKTYNKTKPMYQLSATVKIGDKNTQNLTQSNSVYCNHLKYDDILDVKTDVWKTISKSYYGAHNRIADDKSKTTTVVERKDKAPFFSSPETIAKYYSPKKENKNKFFPSQKTLNEKVKLLSKEFLSNSDITKCDVQFNFVNKLSYFIDSEGAQVVEAVSHCNVFLGAFAQADDGMNLFLFETYYSDTPSGLPSDEEVLVDIKKLSENISLLKKAPLAEPYSGVAMLSPTATGVFFHEFFGHRIEGARLKNESDAGTFLDKIGKPIFSKDVSIVFDPNETSYQGQALSGRYVYDDEGVKGEKVDIVTDGILNQFLMNRTPIDDFPQSNGHGRGQINKGTESRQSNMFITSSNPKTEDELRTILIDEIKAQGKEYGYYIDKVSGGYTSTMVYSPNVFNVSPTLIYKVWADGRPDELVRGVSLIGTPMMLFDQIMNMGAKCEVFNGMCGAGSGWVPVSTISPAMIVRNIETQRIAPPRIKPIIMKRPDTETKE